VKDAVSSGRTTRPTYLVVELGAVRGERNPPWYQCDNALAAGQKWLCHPGWATTRDNHDVCQAGPRKVPRSLAKCDSMEVLARPSMRKNMLGAGI
jgi:hypothetical protein